MKPSEAMLKGFAMAGGLQCKYSYYTGHSKHPRQVCAVGAMNLGYTGDADNAFNKCAIEARDKFAKVFNCPITDANDGGMSIPDIAGILASEGY